jgi:hypothetical protein
MGSIPKQDAMLKLQPVPGVAGRHIHADVIAPQVYKKMTLSLRQQLNCAIRT